MNAVFTQKRWLVVDDDPDPPALTARVLRRLPDREVVACDNPRRALELIAAEPESFEILVTDFQMPELNGCELARRVRDRAPQLGVLLVSASGFEPAAASGAAWDGFLAKPFQAEDLLEAVQILQRRLDTAPGRWISQTK
jgi:two-component system, cell cycle sensor histidine kinase and response regulator CckA